MNPNSQSYVIVSPARNEAKYLPRVIESIVNQKILPTRWVIVSDGSTDATDEIAGEAVKKYPFIQLIRAGGGETRSFGSKAMAFQAGYKALEGIPYGYIANLDADITFEPHYYERMLNEMAKNPKLGVASGVCWENGKQITISYNHAVGAVQFFHRQCYEEIGGYRPATVGGIDALAELTARMKGWETQAFPDLPVYHHKPVDSSNGKTAARISYRAGLTEYHIGTHPLFAFVKAVRRWRQAPAVASVFIRLYAYGKLWLSGVKRDAPDELVSYLKTEQMTTLRRFVTGQRRTP